MQKTTKKIFIMVLFLILLCTVIAFISMSEDSAKADTLEPNDNLNFTLTANSDGESSYKVGIKSVYRLTAEFIIIPNTYNGTPVTEIADNGFVSCTKLTKVILPRSVTKIGKNAFTNCTSLEIIAMPSVESIGDNAFSMCRSLDRAYFPHTVKMVGANILRNNSNTVYIESSEEEVGTLWSSTWNSYFTGTAVYNIDPADTVLYRPIYDTNNIKVIGVEIPEGQILADEGSDVRIYNAVKANITEEDGREIVKNVGEIDLNDTEGICKSVYLPVLNICSEAFTYSQVKSISIMNISEKDKNSNIFDHSINIRSNAFVFSFISEVKISTKITFNHPKNLEMNNPTSSYDGTTICGDAAGRSTRIFEFCTLLETVTLPSDIDIIPERMFKDCNSLTTINIYGENDDGSNKLPSVKKIGDGAFSSCNSLQYLTIPESVEEIGDSVFIDWGINVDDIGFQQINVGFYADELPAGWNQNWAADFSDKVIVNYLKEVEVEIYWCDKLSTTSVIKVKPGRTMPSIKDIDFDYFGYNFNGIYSQTKGGGYQYYTSDKSGNREWNKGDALKLYVNWKPCVSRVTIGDEEYYIEFGQEMPAAGVPHVPGMEFRGYYLLNVAGERVYYYNAVMKGLKHWDRIDESITLNADLKIIEYYIYYYVDGEFVSSDTYTYDDEKTIYPVDEAYYTIKWNISKIPLHSEGNITVIGTKAFKTFQIIYNVREGAVNPNPTEYSCAKELKLVSATHTGYTLTWDKSVIPAKYDTEPVTVTAKETEKALNQCTNAQGEYEIWTLNQFMQLQNQPDGGYGRTYRLMNTIVFLSGTWEPIDEFKGTFIGNNNYIQNLRIHMSSGYVGFCRINSGTIRELNISAYFDNNGGYSNVYVGYLAGKNKGTITDCFVISSGSPTFSYAGESYFGGVAGLNEGYITNTTHNSIITGYCNIGGIAGLNSGYIDCCTAKGIEFDYSDYNACVGGIVGKQTGGYTKNCRLSDRILFRNYQSKNYNSIQEDRSLQLCVGIIIGRKQGGTVSGNTYKLTDAVISLQTLSVVTWTTGSGSSKKTYTNDQSLYFKNEECGRIG